MEENKRVKFVFRDENNEIVYESTVSNAFLHVLTDFEIASCRHNNGKPLRLYFDNLDAFYEQTSSNASPTDFGGAKSTLMRDLKTGEVFVAIFVSFGETQEALIAHEIAHMYLFSIGYPVVSAAKGVTKLATGITNIGSHCPLNYYLRSCGIDVDTDNARRVRNMTTYLPDIDFDSEDPARLSLDFVDNLAYVSGKMKTEFERIVKDRSSKVYELMGKVRSIVNSIPDSEKIHPAGAEKIMRKLCNFFPEAKDYKVMMDFFCSPFTKEKG